MRNHIGPASVSAHLDSLDCLGNSSNLVELDQCRIGCVAVDALLDEPALKSYHLLPGVRGDLLFKLDRKAEAKVEFERAASMTRNERERTLLLKRAAEC